MCYFIYFEQRAIIYRFNVTAIENILLITDLRLLHCVK
jgi:hypothetical protein